MAILAGCSPTNQAIDVPTISPAAPTPTQGIDQNTINTGIESVFSTSPHANKMSCWECHLIDDGVIQDGVYWQQEGDSQPELLPSSTELCIKCHSEPNLEPLAAGDFSVHPEFECSSCHNSHSTAAGCTNSGCHSQIRETITANIEPPDPHPKDSDPSGYMCGGSTCHQLVKNVKESPIYHQPAHKSVPCYVCHDSSGLQVDFENETWVTINQEDQNNNPVTVVSHVFDTKVDCQKCHFGGNPWDLSEVDQTN